MFYQVPDAVFAAVVSNKPSEVSKWLCNLTTSDENALQMLKQVLLYCRKWLNKVRICTCVCGALTEYITYNRQDPLFNYSIVLGGVNVKDCHWTLLVST